MNNWTFEVPDLGEGLTGAEIVQWHVALGEHVTAGQPLVAVETDKAVVEIPSPVSAVVAALRAEVGEWVRMGAPLLDFDTGPRQDAGAVVGTLASGQIRAAPAVRSLARERGVDLAKVSPTGRDGTISSEDVRRAAGAMPAGEPLSGARRAMAERMGAAHREVAVATVTTRADIHGWSADTHPMPRLMRALLRACDEVSALNVAFEARRMTRRLHEHVNLGVAVDTGEGLFVPVIHQADTLSPEKLAAELARLRRAVRERTARREELGGATITLSNFGTLGGEFATMVVVPPQVAIVGAGRIAEGVVAGEQGPVIHRLLPLSLSFDHRVVTGAEATAFLNAMVADLRESV